MKNRNPLELFFKLGDKATKGDPQRKAKFDYIMLWVIFLAFFSILVGNLYQFFTTFELSKLGWAVVMFGILWFQYNGLKLAYESRKLMKDINVKPEGEEKVENVKDMLGGFDK